MGVLLGSFDTRVTGISQQCWGTIVVLRMESGTALYEACALNTTPAPNF